MRSEHPCHARRIATLREAFHATPAWMGFNIELKYPTDAELAAMPTRFYSRSYFCDAVLRVPAHPWTHAPLLDLHAPPGLCQCMQDLLAAMNALSHWPWLPQNLTLLGVLHLM